MAHSNQEVPGTPSKELYPFKVWFSPTLPFWTYGIVVREASHEQ